MPLLLPTNLLTVVVGPLVLDALIDTGAAVSVVRQDVCQRLKSVRTPFGGQTLQGAGAHMLTPQSYTTLRITVAGVLHVVQFVVLGTCSHPMILGWDFLSSVDAVVDCGRSEVAISEDVFLDSHYGCPPKQNKLQVSRDTVVHGGELALVPVVATFTCNRSLLVEPCHDPLLRKDILLPFCLLDFSDGLAAVPVFNLSSTASLLPQGMTIGSGSIYVVPAVSTAKPASSTTTPTDSDLLLSQTIEPNLPEYARSRLLGLLQKFKSAFDLPNTPLGKAIDVEHSIHTDGTTVVRHRPYRVSASERQTISKHVDEMLHDGVIQPSKSPWSSPVVLVKKKDHSLRFCVDYRRLNKITKKDLYPMPRIDDALDTLQGAQYFSSIDLRCGYWQIPMAPDDKAKTAFATPDGLYEFNVMPFGLCNAPATFERMIDSVLRGLKWRTCLCYLDDIVVFSRTFEEHLLRLEEVLQCLSNAGLQLNKKKCRFGARRIKVLGHLVDSAGIRPDPDKLKAVSDFPQPANVKQLRSFLGLASYFRRFVPNFATIAAPLHRLLQQDVPFHWDEQSSEAFSSLRSLLTSDPILGHFDPSAPTAIHTDASGYGLGAVLVQNQSPTATERVISYASRCLTQAERNYSTTEKECLAVVWAVKKFRPYLFGKPFQVITDHHALCWLSSLKSPNGRLGRWALLLQEYDFNVTYKSGRAHRDADALSRCPLPSTVSNDTTVLDLAVLTPMSFAASQRQDPTCRLYLNHLEGRHLLQDRKLLKQVRHYWCENGILYRKNYAPVGDRWLIVVPPSLRAEVLRSLHDDPTAGHSGIFKTYSRARQRFYWPGMYRTIARYVRSCVPCQFRKTPASSHHGLLQPLPCPPVPFHRVGIDLFGPLPRTSAGNRWVLVVIDHATRYVESAALPNATASEVAAFFLHAIVLRHGAPSVLLSDRGRQFLSDTVDELLRACNTVHKVTSAYHPQCNGLTERFNRTLADMISMYVSADHSNWDLILPFVTYAYNTSVQSTTGFSPFHLVYGRTPVTTLDTILPFATTDVHSDTMADAILHAEECRQLARWNTQCQQQLTKQRYDEHRHDVRYAPGDYVLLWTPLRQTGRSPKLLPKYVGPYRIVSRSSPVNYEVEPVNTPPDRRYRTREIVHVLRLRPYFTKDAS